MAAFAGPAVAIFVLTSSSQFRTRQSGYPGRAAWDGRIIEGLFELLLQRVERHAVAGFEERPHLA